MTTVDERIHEALERVGGDVAGPAWESLVARRRRRRAGRAMVGAAAVVLVGAVTVVGIDRLVDSRDGTTQVVTADDPGTGPVDAPTEPLAEVEPAPAGPVAVRGDGVGPLIVETSPLVPSDFGWVEHTITLRNPTEQTVHVNDFRASTFLGDSELLAATDGCGYSGGQGTPVSAGMCLSYYAPLTIDPGEAAELKITLIRGLVGMNPLGGGPFEWDLAVSTGQSAFSHPDQQGTRGTITVTYSDLSDIDPVPPESESRLPDGRHFGLVQSLVGAEEGWWLRLHPATYFSNEEAAQAALDDGVISNLDELPNPFYIRRSDERPIRVWVDGSVPARTIFGSDAPTDRGWDEFVQSYGASPQPGFAPLPIWLMVENGNVIAVEQQYTP